MALWTWWLDVISQGLVLMTHLCGGSTGMAVVAVSLGLRLCWLPIGIALAERARGRRAQLDALRPLLEQLRRQHGDDPATLLGATRALMKEHGVGPIDRLALVPIVAQLPLFAGLFAAIRRGLASGAFLWIGNLARPDALLAACASVLTGLTVLIGSEHSGARGVAVVAAVVMFAVVSRMAAGLGLYLAASAGVGLLQAAVVRVRTA